MSLPRYASYKDSGVQWLGKVPRHWTVMPIRFAARLESGHTPSRNRPDWWENCTVPWFSLADVSQIRRNGVDLIFDTKEKISELGLQNSSARRLPAGTVMLSRTASVGFAAIMGVEMATTQDFANWVCGPSLRPRFLLYVFRAMRGEFARLMIGSTHNTIYMPDIAAFRFALPSVEEQDAATNFLDREITKIDSLIAEQEKLIALLSEKRQATISQAVTKGLDPNAPMKDSGVAWLGEVPAHWQVKRFRDACDSISTGPFGTALGSDDYISGGVPVINPSHIVDSSIVPDEDVSVANEAAERLSSWTLRAGDIVVARRGELGRAAIIEAKNDGWICGTGSLRVTPNQSEATPGFLHAVLQSTYAREWLNQESVGSTMANLNEGILGSLPIALPCSTEEQTQLVRILSQRISDLGATAALAVKSVALLQERRNALIAAAVTGQVDVRNA
ncbi:MAG: restriction endonuclease subunit S [Piscinibacter sp.]